MATTIPATPHASRAGGYAAGKSVAEEWPVYAVLAASASIIIGLIWDISWHRTIGRDTFWSPPHLMRAGRRHHRRIELRLARAQARRSPDLRKSAPGRCASGDSARPLGAWVCIWGTIMMITSAPFDNWWHNAYGLDVKIMSPPHMVLASGMIGIQLGAMLMALARAEQGAIRCGPHERWRCYSPYPPR